MSDIAQKAEISTWTLYIYFKNKEELLNALYIELKKSTFQNLTKWGKNESTQIKLSKIWKNVLDFRLHHYGEAIFLEHFAISPFITKKSKTIESEWHTFLIDILDEWKKQWSIKDIDNEIILSLLSWYSRELSKLMYEWNKKLSKKILDESFTLCWDAIKS